MFVYVINQHGQPLMPCTPRCARLLLEQGKAKVIKKTPFTLKLLYGSSGYKQPVLAAMDTGSKTLGAAALANGRVLYQSQVELRQDITRKMKQRQNYRRCRRSRKTRYRKPRWRNRASMQRKGRLPPSLKSKVDSHLRERCFIESILPITEWKVELASFDIHKITNPDVRGKAYQEGPLKGYYNSKAYVLARDGHRCQSGRRVKHAEKLRVHHLQYRSQGGSDAPDNSVTLCEICHESLHKGEYSLRQKGSKRKHPTAMGVIQGVLRRSGWEFEEVYGYETKYKREALLKLPKSHYNDAVAICCPEEQVVTPLKLVCQKKHVSVGDYQQRKGKHSQKELPTGKLYGYRKYDQVYTTKGLGFIKGKRSSGYFALMDISGKTIESSVNVKSGCTRLSARSSTLIEAQVIN